MPSQIGHHDKRPIHISRSHSKHPAFSNIFSNSLYYPSLYRNEDEKISSSTNSSSSRPRVERSSSTRIANAAKLLRQHLRYLYLSKICIKYSKHGRSSLADFDPKKVQLKAKQWPFTHISHCLGMSYYVNFWGGLGFI